MAQELASATYFFYYPPDTRIVIYTTNSFEFVNMSLRKITKNRGVFPTDEAVLKLFYLALNNISKKWTMPIRDWKAALNRFTIQFGVTGAPAALYSSAPIPGTISLTINNTRVKHGPASIGNIQGSHLA
ncbi:transposase [Sapientia aquatica]|uniref:Mutator family transposase n=1 Tax=Sapientia aquatica TaxID=1549640 RepID=A0A4R5VRD0_9BURK|nr:transposase [Sapientia aquatica]